MHICENQSDVQQEFISTVQQENISRYLPEKDENNKYFNVINKKPIVPSVSELKVNPSSRSAKLRCAIKTRNGCDFIEFIDKFKYLTSVEELKLKL